MLQEENKIIPLTCCQLRNNSDALYSVWCTSLWKYLNISILSKLGDVMFRKKNEPPKHEIWLISSMFVWALEFFAVWPWCDKVMWSLVVSDWCLPYCTISFNSAQVVTRDPKYWFGTSATNNFWYDTSKNLAFKTKNFIAFFAPPTEIWPQCHTFYIWHWALWPVTETKIHRSTGGAWRVTTELNEIVRYL
jgi:hypothetical protein